LNPRVLCGRVRLDRQGHNAERERVMEIQDMLFPDVAESAPPESDGTPLEDGEFDRIAFELWQHGSLPALAADVESDLEEVACHASCL
jgi:hypothetical protein